MAEFMSFFLTSTEEPLEVVEDVLQYNIDDLYRVLSRCADSLEDISGNLDMLQDTGTQILQLLQSSFLDSVAALLLILVGFEIMRLVRGWTKGNRVDG